MDTKRTIKAYTTRGIHLDDMCRVCGSKNRRFIALFRGDGTASDITDYICCYLGISVDKSDGMPQKICSDCKATILSFHDLFVCCQETTEKFLHTIKSKAREPDKKSTSGPPSGKGNSFFSEDDDNDNLVDGSVLKDIEMVLAKDVDNDTTKNEKTIARKSEVLEKEKVEPATEDMPEKSIEEEPILITACSPTTKLNAWKNCEYCPKKFLTKTKLIDHIKDKHNELIFHCEMCDGYVARSDLILHMTHHALFPGTLAPSLTTAPTSIRQSSTGLLFPAKSVVPATIATSIASPDTATGVTAKTAAITSPNRQPSLINAPPSVNGSPATSPAKDDRQTINNGGSSKENHSPKKTEIAPQQQYQCHSCEKQFAVRSRLRYHVKRFHEKIKYFHCDMCDKRFSCRRIILNHIRGVHIKEKTYACDQCPKVFKVDSALYAHKKSHDDKYLFFCKECDGKFKSRAQLNVHFTMHTKEKNYFCTVCNKGFAVRNNLTKHLRTHSSSFDFKCHICSYAANQKRYLQEHMKRSHQTVLPSNNC